MWHSVDTKLYACRGCVLEFERLPMDIQGFSEVRSPTNVVANKTQPVELRPKALRESQHVVDKSGSTTTDSKADKTRQRVQPLMNAISIPVEPVDFRTGAAETFIDEMDLVKRQTLVPAEGQGLPPSLDTLV